MDIESSDVGQRMATISWLPPPFQDQNGVILYYQLIFSQSQFDIPNIVANSSTITYTVSTLEEYTEYVFTVAAATSIGLGPFSSPMVFMTLPTSEYRIHA